MTSHFASMQRQIVHGGIRCVFRELHMHVCVTVCGAGRNEHIEYSCQGPRRTARWCGRHDEVGVSP
jgi:hypothetical protein